MGFQKKTIISKSEPRSESVVSGEYFLLLMLPLSRVQNDLGCQSGAVVRSMFEIDISADHV
jgi:hypothetical protein